MSPDRSPGAGKVTCRQADCFFTLLSEAFCMSSVTSGLNFTPVLTSGVSYPGGDTWHRHRGPDQALIHLPRAETLLQDCLNKASSSPPPPPQQLEVFSYLTPPLLTLHTLLFSLHLCIPWLHPPVLWVSCRDSKPGLH